MRNKHDYKDPMLCPKVEMKHYKTTSEALRTILTLCTFVLQLIIAMHILGILK